MEIIWLLAIIIPMAWGAAPEGGDGKIFVCYWGSWSHYRQGEGQFRYENIDPNMCTHLMYSYAILNDNGEIQAYDPYLDLGDYTLGMYTRLVLLKEKNPELKTMIAIGGWLGNLTKFSQMASTAAGRTKFVESVAKFLEKHQFDGLDFDWEYPGARGGKPEDKQNFVLTLKELREEFDKRDWLLTAAVSARKPTIDAGYDIPNVAKYLHLINVMCYDYFGAWDNTTGHNAPIRPHTNASTELEYQYNIEFTINYWINNGAPANKLILGLPLYGRSFTLRDPKNFGYGDAVTGPGPAGPFTKEAGYLSYNEICGKLRNNSYEMYRDKNVGAPYAVRDREWIGFDDVDSLTYKVAVARGLGLGGAMAWSIEADDFLGKCHGVRFPLINSIKAALNRDYITLSPTAPTPISPTPSDEFQCESEGFFPHPESNTKFIGCTESSQGTLVVTIFECPAGTVFDKINKICTWP